jgi:hypothetical protein
MTLNAVPHRIIFGSLALPELGTMTIHESNMKDLSRSTILPEVPAVYSANDQLSFVVREFQDAENAKSSCQMHYFSPLCPENSEN